jgi:hypothetical protein
MVKRLLLLIIVFLFVISFVCAGPLRDVVVHVEDLNGDPVGNGLVVMSKNNSDFFDYSAYTDDDGLAVFEGVDSRVWISSGSNDPMVRGFNSSKKINSNDKSGVVMSSQAIYNKRLNFAVFNSQENLVSNGSYVVNFRFDPVNLDFEVDDLGPYFLNIPNIEVDDFGDGVALYNLHAVVFDSDTDFEDLSIDVNCDFSSAEGICSFDQGNGLFSVDFFPELNLEYHTNNVVTISLNVSDGFQSASTNFDWVYNPSLTALHGKIYDLYYNNSVSDNLFNGNFENIYTDEDNSEFIAFFDDSEDASVEISNSDYYLSQRHFSLNEDTFLNMTVAPIQDESGEDLVEEQFDCSFRWAGPGMMRYLAEPIMFLCLNETYYDYEPTQENIDDQVTAAASVSEFTNGFIDFDGGNNVFQGNNCSGAYDDFDNVIMVYWDPDMGSIGGNAIDFVGYVITDSFLSYKAGYEFLDMSTYYQETLQGLGPRQDCNIINSVFNDPGAPVYPVWTDFKFGQRLYTREPGNVEHDTDPSYSNSKNYDKAVFTEVLRVQDYLLDDEKVTGYELLGYAPKGDTNKNRMVQELPKGVVLETFRHKLFKNKEKVVRVANKNKVLTQKQKELVKSLIN